MGVVRALLAEIGKMFAADLVLTAIALAVVAFCALGLRAGLVGPAAIPFILAGGVLAALAVGVARGARR